MSITMVPSVHSEASIVGVQFQAFRPATFRVTSDAKVFGFPAVPAVQRGLVKYSGTFAIGASLNRIDLGAPYLSYTTKAGVRTGRITFQDESEAINGNRVALFDVDNVTVRATKGKIVKVGTRWARTDRLRITGDVSIVNNSRFVRALNSYIGTTFFRPGQEFGTLQSSVSTTVRCTTLRECS